MTDTADLIERLEKAPFGEVKLDEAIAIAIGWKRTSRDHSLITGLPMPRADEWHHPTENTVDLRAPEFTTSIDAKLPWENITAMGWFEVVPGEALGEVCEAWHENQKSGLRTMGAGKTEAIARRVAALRARQSETPDLQGGT